MDLTKNSISYCSFLLLLLLSLLSLLSVAKSEVIQVGGENRWSDGVNYVSWASQLNFSVGDVLVFRYTEGKHNVYEVSKAAYESCDKSKGVNAKYESGNDQVELKEAKPYRFICTVEEHCNLGMKFTIDVAPSSNTSSPSPSPNHTFLYSPSIYLLSAAAILSFLLLA